MKTSGALVAALALLAFGGAAPAKDKTGVPQASITLGSSNAEFCNHHLNEWSLTKTGVLSDSVITWTVAATKDSSAPNVVQADGYLVVTNTGTANATIGNIVVNLQRRYKQKWVSVAADCADATSGDAATSANIVAKASQEDPALNNTYYVGPGNYTVTGQQGTFVETAGSGSLNFFDVNNNTVFSLVPELSLAPGAGITLLYSASFNNSYLGLSPGAQVRVEVLVTFGNAGGRGGSGASAPGIDINGNSKLDTDEAWVRTVPTRTSRELPPLEECNQTAVLTDQPPLATTGTATYSTFSTDIGGGTGTQVLTGSGTFTVTADVSGGASGGYITNCATLAAQPDNFINIDGYLFPCCPGVDLDACSTLWIDGSTPPPHHLPGFTTYTQGGWGAKPHGNNPGALLAANFSSLYPSGVTVGGGFTMSFTSPKAVEDYLPAGGTPGVLTSSLENPLTSSSGVFGGQVLTLRLNVDFSASGVLPSGLGGLIYNNPFDSTDYFNGKTVSDILAAANVVLGGAPPPGAYSVSSLNDLVTSINEAFDSGGLSSWALTYLSSGT